MAPIDGSNQRPQSQQPAPPLVPPPPFADFDFTLSPTMGGFPHHVAHSPLAFNFPNPPPMPNFDTDLPPFDVGAFGAGNSAPPADLLSSTEQTDLLGFLEQIEWNFDPVLPQGLPEYPKHHPFTSASGASTSEDHTGNTFDRNRSESALGLVAPMETISKPGASSSTSSVYQSASTNIASSSSSSSTAGPSATIALQPTTSSTIDTDAMDDVPSERPAKRRKSSLSEYTSSAATPTASTPAADKNAPGSRKALLTQPQKRLNHIMSEQRRRTAIKDGFNQLEKIIAPDPAYTGPAPTLPVPLDKDGRPRRGVKAKALRGKGKMGTLFRTVEYLRYLEEGVNALQLEVERLEAIDPNAMPGMTLHGHPGLVSYSLR